MDFGDVANGGVEIFGAAAVVGFFGKGETITGSSHIQSLTGDVGATKLVGQPPDGTRIVGAG